MIGSERTCVVPLAIAGALLCARPAAAQPTTAAAATVEFDKGRDLLKKGKFAEACAAFAQSQKLDPAPGTLYNLAGCYVKIGKLASAWLAFRELAQKDTKEARKKDAAKQAAELEPRLPKLLIAVAGTAPAGLVVTMNGENVTALVGVTSPVDLGSYTIVAKAPTYADFTTTADIAKEGETTTITVALAHPVAAPTNPPPVVATKPEPRAHPDRPPDTGDEHPASHRKIYGIAAGAAGVAVIATGLVFGNRASSKWSDVKKLCGDDLACDPGQLDQGKHLSDQAHFDANLATGLVIGGAAIAALGGYLLFTAPSHADRTPTTALRLAPSVGTTTVGLSLEGGF